MHTVATTTCAECNALYCEECDRVLHKHPTKKFHHRSSLHAPIFQFPPIQDFYTDLRKLVLLVSNSGPLRTYSATRLDIIDNLFVFHTLLNEHLEHKVHLSVQLCSTLPSLTSPVPLIIYLQARMDISLHESGKIRKVDNHVHLAGIFPLPTCCHLYLI